MVMSISLLLVCLVLLLAGGEVGAYRTPGRLLSSTSSQSLLRRVSIPTEHYRRRPSHLLMVDDNVPQPKDGDAAEDAVKKYGLEAGLYQAVTSKDTKLKPKDLLAKYGIAYLVTSITLAIFSYAFFYALVANGVDVASLLEKIGIASSSTATSTGTAAIAYALHKAASPIRFPPTVLLTPVVANLLGKKPSGEKKDA